MIVCTCSPYPDGSHNANPHCPVGNAVGNHDLGRAIDDVEAKNRRPGWDEYFLNFAVAAAVRATCDRKHVGAVIVNERHIIVGTGYNGAPRGMPHCSGPHGVGHELKEVDGRLSCVRTIHAESNALDSAGRLAFGGTLYVTVTPCYPCTQRIVNSGIRRVVYGEWYNSQNTGLVAKFLEQAGVELIQAQPSASLLSDELLAVFRMVQDACSERGDNQKRQELLDGIEVRLATIIGVKV